MNATRIEFYSDHIVKARKEYPCKFCGQPIPKGTHYVAVAHGTSSGISSHRAHLKCQDAADGQTRSAPIPPT